jgi:outer membrane protein OmpA-like peptidoglycan-associated protein/tetratricopeptide (TPR) repeat protein
MIDRLRITHILPTSHSIGRGVLLLVLLLAAFTQMAAQNASLRRGDHFYEATIYPKAVKSYERGLKRQPDQRAIERLGDAYRQLGLTHKAEACYAEAVKSPDVATSIKLHYADMLKANGNYDAAQQWYQAYLLMGAEPNRAARAIQGCELSRTALADSSQFSIARLSFNTSGSEFGPAIYQNGLLVAMEKRGGLRRALNLRNYNHFYDLYFVRQRDAGNGYRTKRLKGKVNGPYHEGPSALNSLQNELYFTRSFFVKGKSSLEPRDQSRLKLMRATFARGRWQNIVEMPFNSDAYSCGHPALDSEAQLLVFASDLPGGFGGTDLYMCMREGFGWSNPLNLGPEINTEGNERFPFLHEDGTLFFASDGLPGLGGLDLFFAAAKGDGWHNPQNLGYPLNSRSDDFSLAWHRNRATGYLASDRAGNDDIYSFRRQCKLEGTVVDARSGLPISGARINLRAVNGQDAQYSTPFDGRFEHACTWGDTYLVEVKAPGFLPIQQQVHTNDIASYADKTVILRLQPDLIFTFSGAITDAKTKAPLPNAQLRVISSNQRFEVDAQGKFDQALAQETDYTVLVTAPGHIPQFFRMSTVGRKVTERWVFNPQLEPGNYLLVEGKTMLNPDNKPVAGADVAAIAAASREELASQISREDGRFWHILQPGSSQYLVTTHPGHFVTRTALPTTPRGQDTTITIDIPIVPYKVGAIVKTIYYDYNKSDLLDLASTDLNDIVYFLKANPEASVELSSHTDSRGGDTFNAQLSQSRADAAVNYIVSKGVERKRIVAKGYGESALVNGCKDNVPCSESEHGMNRRTEIKVIRIAGMPKSN